jgi:hypothetical protein
MAQRRQKVKQVRPATANLAESVTRSDLDYLHAQRLQLEMQTHFTERLAEIEIAFENQGWQALTGAKGWTFSRDFLKKSMEFARKCYIENPLINRAVDLQALYVWALGVEMSSSNDDAMDVVNRFFNDPKNKNVIGTLSARMQIETEQQLTGNTFFAFFTNSYTGNTRLRTIEPDEIVDIYCNPEDSKEPWFYKRSYSPSPGEDPVTVWLVDINYHPIEKTSPKDQDGKYPVLWDGPRVYHVKTGGLSRMKFGFPEPYSGLKWAGAYKRFLENWCTIMEAYAQIAMIMTGNKGKAGVASAKQKLAIGTAGAPEELGAPAATLVATGGVDLQAVKTAGSTTSAEEGYPVKLMVAAAVGLPGTFFGDADVGNFATSQTLDRPTELKMVSRQGLWVEILGTIINYLLFVSAKGRNGILHKAGYSVETTANKMENCYEYDIVTGDGTSSLSLKLPDEQKLAVRISFPSILERNADERVRAVIGALTYMGETPHNVIPSKRHHCKLLLEALGEKNVTEYLDKYYPEDEDFPDPADMEMEKIKIQGEQAIAQAELQGDQAMQQTKIKASAAKAKPAAKKAGAKK